jgi:hypothetical protein
MKSQKKSCNTPLLAAGPFITESALMLLEEIVTNPQLLQSLRQAL